MEDVIAAISTPYGRGGIAVIRISGDGAIECAERFFKPKSGKAVTDIPTGRVVYGDILRDGERIDDGMCAVFRAPNSFTGEDTVEISCHGGILITQCVLESAYICGARPAAPGEFSKRAFISGKMSLSQAEAVIDIIDAESREALKIAAAQTKGVLSDKIESIRQSLISLLSQAYVYIDYPDEDMTDISTDEAEEKLSEILSQTVKLADTYQTGSALSKGIKTVIFGKPNTGKSSLLNALCRSDRAIVTDIAGTTRDTVRESCRVGKIQLHLSDTAGVHKTEDAVEKIGVERAYSELSKAELVFAVFDMSGALGEEDFDILTALDNTEGLKAVFILNKCDAKSDAFDKLHFEKYENTIEISCRENIGIDILTETVNNLFIDGSIDITNDAVISNARQYASLKKAEESIENALSALKSGMSLDIAGMDIELAVGALGELDGRSVGEEIVNNIFHRFCVGK